jgi:hypothetical protein
MTGALTVATLDLRPFLDGDPRQRGEPLGYDELARQSLPLRNLVPFDVDLDLRVARWLGLPGDVRDARLELRADARGVRAPIGATFAGVPLSGRLDLDTAAATPAFALELGARGSALGDLARVLTGATGIDGTLGRFDQRLGGRGETVGTLVRDLELALAVAASRLSYGNVAGGRSVAFTLDALDVTAGPSARARRAHAARRAPALSIRGGSARHAARARRAGRDRPRDRQRQGPDRGHARTPGSNARHRPRVPARRAALRRPLAPAWRCAGIEPTARAARPRARRERRVASRRDDAEARAQRPDHRCASPGIGGKPIFVAAVRTLIDVPELETLRARQSTPAEEDRRSDLPYGIDLEDADLGLGLQGWCSAAPSCRRRLRRAHSRRRLSPSPFAAISPASRSRGSSTRPAE